MTAVTSIDILTDARARIVSGVERDPTRAIGQAASSREAWASLAHSKAAIALHLAVGKPGLDLLAWTEAPGRTKAELILALDGALEVERGAAVQP